MRQPIEPFRLMWPTVAGADAPLGGDIGGHLEEISLRMLDQLGPVITHEAQKDLLRHVVHVRSRHAAGLAEEEAAHRRTPLTEPVRNPTLCSSRGHRLAESPRDSAMVSVRPAEVSSVSPLLHPF